MKRVSIFIISLLAVATAAQAQSRLEHLTVKSEILGVEKNYSVYLPDGYDKGDERYPVLYLLHGAWGNHKSWNRDGGGEQPRITDEMIAAGKAVKMIVVMPDATGIGARRGGKNMGYFNVSNWAYEDFFFQEFLPAMEKKYQAVGDKEHRAVMGLSMGGGGSTVYCQRHPDMFSSCYAMSPWLDNQGDNVGPGDKKDKLYLVCEAVKAHSALRFVEQADDATKEKLRTVKWFFDCGDDDFLFDQSVRMHQLMRNARIHDELRVRNGVHNWEYWHVALRMALPFASRNFGR